MATDTAAAVNLTCPRCGGEQIGSADVVQCTARGHWEQNADGVRVFVPSGETTIHWDTQKVWDESAPCWCRECDWAGPPAALVARKGGES